MDLSPTPLSDYRDLAAPAIGLLVAYLEFDIWILYAGI
jgi:hypothetical protein